MEVTTIPSLNIILDESELFLDDYQGNHHNVVFQNVLSDPTVSMEAKDFIIQVLNSMNSVINYLTDTNNYSISLYTIDNYPPYNNFINNLQILKNMSQGILELTHQIANSFPNLTIFVKFRIKNFYIYVARLIAIADQYNSLIEKSISSMRENLYPPRTSSSDRTSSIYSSTPSSRSSVRRNQR